MGEEWERNGSGVGRGCCRGGRGRAGEAREGDVGSDVEEGCGGSWFFGRWRGGGGAGGGSCGKDVRDREIELVWWEIVS